MPKLESTVDETSNSKRSQGIYCWWKKNLQKSTGAVVVQDPILVRVANSHRDQDLA
jgi:hypothetical protein